MKVSHILGLTLTVSLLSFGGWLGCSDGSNANNPDGKDAAAFDTGTSPPPAPDANDAAPESDAAPMGDASTESDAQTDSGADSGADGGDAAAIRDASDAG
jgi:hypothetical protein